MKQFFHVACTYMKLDAFVTRDFSVVAEDGEDAYKQATARILKDTDYPNVFDVSITFRGRGVLYRRYNYIDTLLNEILVDVNGGAK